MFKKISDKTFDLALTEFATSDGAYKNVAKISDNIDVKFVDQATDEPWIEIEEVPSGVQLKWRFIQAATNFGAFKNNVKLSNSVSKIYDNITVGVKALQNKLKIDYTLAKAPAGVLTLEIQTNLTPVQDRGRFLDPLNQGNHPDAYERINWIRPDGTQFAYWDSLPIIDSIGQSATGYYRQIVNNGNGNYSLDLYINPTDMAKAVYPVTIDPTTIITGAGYPFLVLSSTMHRSNNYNGTIDFVIFATSSGGNVESWWSDDKFVTPHKVTVPSAISTHLYFKTCIDSNGDFHIVSIPTMQLGAMVWCKFNATTKTYGAPTTIHAGGYGPEGIVIDQNDNIFILYLSSAFSHRLVVSTNGGTSFADVSAAGGGSLGGGKLWWGSWNNLGMSIDSNDLIHIVFNGSDSYPYYQTYNYSTSTFSSNTKISTTASIFNQPGFRWDCIVDDNNGRIFAYWTDWAFNPILSKLESGVWTDLGTLTGANNLTVTDNGKIIGLRYVGANGIITTWTAAGGISSETPFAADDDVMFSCFFTGNPDSQLGGNIRILGAKSGSAVFYTLPNDDHISGAGDVDPPTGVLITSPTNGETDVTISPTITCSAGSDVTPPIEYYFQVDIVNTFDSASIQESGWILTTTWMPAVRLYPNTTYYLRVRARDSVVPPNTGSYTSAISFTTTSWMWPSLTRPKIIYSGTTINFPVPVKCQLIKSTNAQKNIGLDGSIETIDIGYQEEMSVIIYPVLNDSFRSEMVTWFNTWAGLGYYFDFTSGHDSRYDGYWLLKDAEFSPQFDVGGSYRYELTFWRIYS